MRLPLLALFLIACDTPWIEPVTVPTCALPQENPRYMQLATDGNVVMALRTDGRAVCWGDDRFGQCGFSFGALGQIDAVLSPVPTCATWVGVDIVGAAVRPEGTLVEWGAEDTVQFADGPDRTRSFGVEKRIPIPGRVKAASQGAQGLAVTDEGDAYCWGCFDEEGVRSDVPVQLITGGLVKAVVENDGWCVLLEMGELHCAGRNEYGQVGDGTQLRRTELVKTLLPEPAIQVATGTASACAILQSERVMCWGYDIWSSLHETFPLPQWVDGVEGVTQIRVVQGSSGGGCAFRPGGRAYCWGHAMRELLPDTVDGMAQPFTPIEDVLDMALGEDGGGCVLRASDNQVYCIGTLRGWADDPEGFKKLKPIPEPRIPTPEQM